MRRKFRNILIALFIIILIPVKANALPERITIKDIGKEPSTYYSGYNKCNTSDCKSGIGKNSANILLPDIYNAYTTDGRLISDAYCLDPGTPFGKEENGYVLRPEDIYDVNSCMNSNERYECAIAGVFYKAQEKGYWQYIVINNAVRLVQAKYGKMNSINAYGRARVNIFTQTSKFLDNGNTYNGLNPKTDYVLYTNAENAQYLKAAADIYKEVMSGFSFNRKTANKPNKEDLAISYDESQKILIVVVETDFEESEISSLLVNSKKLGNLTSYHSHEMKTCEYDSSKNCIYVKISYDKSSVKDDDNIIISLVFDGKDDIASSVGLYTYAKSPNNHQRFVIYDETSRANIELTYPIEPNPTCNIIDNKYYGREGNLLTGFDEYQKECGCFKENGKYYVNNEEVGYETYKNTCGCKIIDNKYYIDINDEPVSEEEYRKVCPLECDTRIKENMPGDCEKNGSEGTIADPSICSILSDKESKNKYKVDKYSNEYCDVYCRETLNFTFMDKETALAGRYFKHSVESKYSNIEYLSTVILSSRQCFSITDYDKWKTDYVAANNKVRTSWNSYKEWESLYNLNNGNPTSTYSGGGGASACNGATAKDHITYQANWETSSYYITNESGYEILGTHTSEIQYGSAGSCRSSYYPCTPCPPSEPASGTSWSTNSTDIIGTKPVFNGKELPTIVRTCACGGGGCRSGSCSNATSANLNYVKTNYNNTKTDYEHSVNKRNELVEKINNCNFVDGSTTYVGILGTKLNNNVKIEYDEKMYTDKISIKSEETAAKVVKRGYGSSNDYYSYCSDCYGTASGLSSTSANEHLTYWTCNGSGTNAECHDVTSKIFPTNKVANIVVEKESLHYQSSQFYTQVLTGKVDTNKTNVGYWITMDPYIYPVSIKRPTGSYGIYVTYSNLGSNRNKSTKFNSGEFTCSYDVINDLDVFECPEPPCNDTIGEGGTLGVYFRTIDLTNIFSQESSTPSSHREYGINWKTGNGPIVQEEIEKLGNDIWTKATPRYSITLTPNMINSIKKYNSANSYLDYSISCSDSKNPLNCTSDFLKSDLRTIMGDKYDINYDSTIKFNSLYYYKEVTS